MLACWLLPRLGARPGIPADAPPEYDYVGADYSRFIFSVFIYVANQSTNATIRS